MLEFGLKDLEIYKNNLNRRKKTFNVEIKRNSKNILVNGKKVAKLKVNNSISPLERNDSAKVLNLFASVKKSINKYLNNNNFTIIKIVKKYNSTFTNRPLYSSLEIGTKFYYVDVKHCYWRIAYLQGYLSEYYYLKILENPEMKLWRNMALSCIIAGKKVEYYKDGKHFHTVSEHTQMYEQVYENIRFYAWNLFGRLCFEKIGEDRCMGYFTDGIMILEEDLKTVRTVLARHKLQFRILSCEKTEQNKFVTLNDGIIHKF